MPSGGLSVSDEILGKYMEVKERKGSLDFITMKLNKKGTKIILNQYFPREDADIAERKADDEREANFLTRVWPKFVAEMKKPHKGKPLPQYAVLGSYFTLNGRKQDRLLFFCWNPDSASIKQKMLLSSTKDTVTAQLQGIHCKFNFTDPAEFV